MQNLIFFNLDNYHEIHCKGVTSHLLDIVAIKFSVGIERSCIYTQKLLFVCYTSCQLYPSLTIYGILG